MNKKNKNLKKKEKKKEQNIDTCYYIGDHKNIMVSKKPILYDSV